MQVYATLEEISRLEQSLIATAPKEAIHVQLLLAWYKRQQDSQAALRHAEYVQAALPAYRASHSSHSSHPQSEYLIELECRLKLIHAEIAALNGQREEADHYLNACKLTLTEAHLLQALGDTWIVDATLAIATGDSHREAKACEHALDCYARGDDLARYEFAQAWQIYESSFYNPGDAKQALKRLRQQGQFLTQPHIAAHLAAAEGVIEGKRAPAQATKFYLRASQLASLCGLHRHAIISAGNACEAFQVVDDLESATQAIELAMNQAQTARWPSMIAFCLAHLGRIQRTVHQIEASESTLKEAIQHFPPDVSGINKAVALRELAETYFEGQKISESLRSFEQAIEILRSVHSMDDLPQTLIRYARVLSYNLQVNEALTALEEAKQLIKKYHYAALASTLYQTLAEVYQRHQLSLNEALSEPNAVIHFLEQAHKLGKQIDTWRATPDFLLMLSDAWGEAGHYQQALRYAQLAINAEREAGNLRVAYKTAQIQDNHQTEKAQAEARYHHLIAISESNRARTLQDTRDTLVKLAKIGQELTSNLETNSVLHAIHDHLKSLLDTDRFLCYIHAPAEHQLQLTYGIHHKSELPPHTLQLTQTEHHVVRCFLDKRDLLVDDPCDQNGACLDDSTEATEVQQSLFAPLMSGDKILGVMSVQSHRKDAYQDRERLIFTSICAYATIAFENARVYQQLQSTQDQLLSAIDHLSLAKEKESRERRRAEENTKLKSEFLANMSHEIRTPMNAIIGMSYLMQSTELNFKQRDYLGKIQQAANSLLGLINDILDFSKIEAGKLQIENQAFSLRELINQVSSLCAHKATDKGLAFHVQIPERLPRKLMGDRLRLGQVLLNLLNNAIKFTQQGSITLLCQLDEIPSEQKDHVLLHFSIIDTGIGIAKEHQSRLFEAFTQADGSVTRQYGGTGLGLSISRQLLQLMGGDIQLNSELNQGSRFDLRLALKTCETRRDNVWNKSKLSVLVMTSSTPNFASITQALSQIRPLSSFQIEHLSSIEQISARLETNSAMLDQADLLFCDVDHLQLRALSQWVSDSGQPESSQTHHLFVMNQDTLAPNQVMQWHRRYHVIQLPMTTEQWVRYLNAHHDFQKHLEQESEREQATPTTQLIHMPASQYHILLAEDNEFNQEIAVELLNQAGYTVDVANHGQEVLNKLHANEPHYYDLILMDLEMPVMDGHQATMMIRKDARFQHLPIIALTAHAMVGTKEKCVEEGMQDYLTKPFEPASLFDMIAAWIGKSPSSASIEGDNRSQAILQFPFQTIDITLGLRATAQNHPLYLKLLNSFRQTQDPTYHSLVDPHAPEDHAAFARLVHTLKGASATIGARYLSGAAESYENYMQNTNSTQRDPVTINQILGQVAQELQACLRELDHFFSQQSKIPSANANTAQVCSVEEKKQLIDHLSTLLEASSADAIDYFEQESSRFQFLLADQFPLFEHTIRQYDFDSAFDMLSKLNS